MPPVRLCTDAYSDEPGLDTAVSHALLEAVARGEAPETLRLYQPAREVVFGPRDAHMPGYGAACEVAREHGFHPVERVAGGRAAIFHEGTIALAWAMPAAGTDEAVAAITARYELFANSITAALHDLGVDARIGEVPGEYCPGRWSVNAGGRLKLAGIGQRLIRGGAYTGGVLVVQRSGLVRDVLVPVYRALELEFDPQTVGAVEDVVPGVDAATVQERLIARFSEQMELVDGKMPEPIVERARNLTVIPRR